MPLLLVYIIYIIYFYLIILSLFYHTILVSELILALDRHRDITNNNSTTNKVSIKSFEDISETLDSLAKTQNLLFNKIQNLENKVNDIFNILKAKEQQIHFSTNELDKITTQLSKLNLGKTTNHTSTKFVLAKPRK